MLPAFDVEDEEEHRLRQAVMRPSTFAIHEEFQSAQERHAEVMPVRHKRAMFSQMRSLPEVKVKSFFPRHGATVGELSVLHVLVPPAGKRVPGSEDPAMVAKDAACQISPEALEAERLREEQRRRELARARERERQRNRVRVRHRAKPKTTAATASAASAASAAATALTASPQINKDG